jgi:tight adherence protein B
MKEIVCILLFGASLYTFIIILPVLHRCFVRYERFVAVRFELWGQMALKPVYFCMIQVLAGFGMGYLITDMVGIFWGMMAALIGFTMPLAVLHLSILRRQNVFASQVVAALTLWSSSLSAGFSVLQSIELVGKESPPPLGYEFKRMVAEVKLGMSIEEVLRNLCGRIPNDDMAMVSTAVAIQMETGGNLSEILGRVCESIRERNRIKGQLKTVTAQGRLTGIVIVLIPFGLYMVMSLLEPGFFTPMFGTSLGRILLCVGGTLEVIGIFTMIRICRVEV